MTGTPLLIIDDETAYSQLLKLRLEMKGVFTVRLAGDAKEGLAALSDERPAAVLCDVNLPDLAGEALVRQIKASMPEVAVFVVTGDGRDEEKTRCLAAGADAYLIKPLDIDVFVQTVLPRFLK